MGSNLHPPLEPCVIIADRSAYIRRIDGRWYIVARWFGRWLFLNTDRHWRGNPCSPHKTAYHASCCMTGKEPKKNYNREGELDVD